MRQAPHPGHVSLSCPTLDTTGLAEEIRKRGNVPLRVADSMIIELSMRDLRQSWATAAKLPAQKVASLSWALAREIEDDDPAMHPGEAIALFVLALRRQQASLERAISGCRIRWTHDAKSEKVEYLT
jgi:hypothetical protein